MGEQSEQGGETCSVLPSGNELFANSNCLDLWHHLVNKLFMIQILVDTYISVLLQWHTFEDIFAPTGNSTVVPTTVYCRFFATCIYEFMKLTVDYLGGPELMWMKMRGGKVPLKSPPLACCCPCCPELPFVPWVYALGIEKRHHQYTFC